MKQRIIGFHQDEHGDWVADLECRPWATRPSRSTLERKALGLDSTRERTEVGRNACLQKM